MIRLLPYLCLILTFFIGFLHAEPVKPITITSAKFQLNGKKRQLSASGNVVISQGDMVIKSKEALYKSHTQKISVKDDVVLKHRQLTVTSKELIHDIPQQKLIANGAVKLTINDIRAESEQAEYFIKSKQMILSINPHAWQNHDEVTGLTLMLDLIRNQFVSTGKSKLRLSADTLEKSPE